MEVDYFKCQKKTSRSLNYIKLTFLEEILEDKSTRVLVGRIFTMTEKTKIDEKLIQNTIEKIINEYIKKLHQISTRKYKFTSYHATTVILFTLFSISRGVLLHQNDSITYIFYMVNWLCFSLYIINVYIVFTLFDVINYKKGQRESLQFSKTLEKFVQFPSLLTHRIASRHYKCLQINTMPYTEANKNNKLISNTLFTLKDVTHDFIND